MEPPGSTTPRPAGEALDLLVIENDAKVAELLAWFLARRGHRVRCAASFAQARELIAERTPELLLSDIELGSENGCIELPRLAAENLLPPTLVVSGYLDRPSEHRLRELSNVLGVVRKPYEFAELEALIAAIAPRARGGAMASDGAPAHEPAPGVAERGEGGR
jgi:DNA-binding response OmpR family regulator